MAVTKDTIIHATSKELFAYSLEKTRNGEDIFLSSLSKSTILEETLSTINPRALMLDFSRDSLQL